MVAVVATIGFSLMLLAMQIENNDHPYVGVPSHEFRRVLTNMVNSEDGGEQEMVSPLETMIPDPIYNEDNEFMARRRRQKNDSFAHLLESMENRARADSVARLNSLEGSGPGSSI